MPQYDGPGVFYVPHAYLARVYRAYPSQVPNETSTSMKGTIIDTPTFCDAIPLDYGRFAQGTAVMMPFGMFRMPRVGQFVKIDHMKGLSQVPVVNGGHLFNQNPTPGWYDPVPGVLGQYNEFPYTNPDDLGLYHDETGAWMRFRNTESTPQSAAADGGPCEWTLQFRSGALVQVLEYRNPAYNPLIPQTAGSTYPIGPASTGCTITVSTPGGASIVMDDAQKTVTITDQGGNQILLDGVGHSPPAISIIPASGAYVAVGAGIDAISGAARAIPSQADIQSTINSVVQTSLVKMAAQMGVTCATNAGAGTVSAFANALAVAWEASSFITGIAGIIPSAPSCSSITRIAP